MSAKPAAGHEGEFAELLQSIQPTRSMFDMTHHALRTLWEQQKDRASDRKKSLSAEMREIDAGIKKLVDRVIETDNDTLIAAYEKRIGEAEARKAELAEKLSGCGRPLTSFDQASRASMAFLANLFSFGFPRESNSKGRCCN